MNTRRLIIKPLLSLLLIAFSLQAEAQYFKLKKVSDPTGTYGDLDFPVLTGKTAAENRSIHFARQRIRPAAWKTKAESV